MNFVFKLINKTLVNRLQHEKRLDKEFYLQKRAFESDEWKEQDKESIIILITMKALCYFLFSITTSELLHRTKAPHEF